MKIKKLKLENFRGFKSFECDFESDLNVLVGLNGQGKTSLLDAIAIAFGQFSGGFGTGKDKGVLTGDIHLAKLKSDFSDDLASGYSMEYQFPVMIQAESFEQELEQDEYLDLPESWERNRNTLKGRTTQVKELKAFAQRLQKNVQDNEKVRLPLISYYGTGRLWALKRLTEKNNPQNKKGSRLDGYQNCLDPESSYNAFSSWLRKETIADIERKMQIIEQSGLEGAIVSGKTIHSKLIQAITTAINTVLAPSGWFNIRYSATSQEIIATHKDQGDVPVSSLSDGVRNMIGMVADIAYRAVRLNPYLLEDAVKKTSGIVLIDEIDMHLHPEWQQLILQQLNQAFPKLQFIVTTHSPQVLSTVKRENIRLLSSYQCVGLASLPMGLTYGEASSDLLERVMNVDSRPPLPEVQKYRSYIKLVDTGNYNKPEAVKLRSELEELLSKEHDDLVKADRSIKRQEFLAK